jgi:putative phosphoribosyl transferase
MHAHPAGPLVVEHAPKPVAIPAAGVSLGGTLTQPPYSYGIVLFAHGSGSSRFSPRNRLVADELVAANLSTLLFDLLTEREAADRGNVFDVALLAERLRHATDWLATQPATADLPLGYFGASTGAAAALVAAARDPRVRAVVSRGGRPDLAGEFLAHVRAPTLLIVGGADTPVLDLNRAALARLGGLKRLEVVPGATHLFEEPGALESVAALARLWFAQHLGHVSTGGSRVEAVR